MVAAGSLLGIAMHSNDSFPVGKVDFMDLYPLSFSEFLEAVGQEAFARLLAKKDWGLIAAFRSKLIDLLKQYYYVGGMPEVVNAFINHKDYAEVRQLQQTILDSYDRDFSKHAPIAEVPRIRMIWRSVPAQLAKENKKFIYGVVKEGARAKDFEFLLAGVNYEQSARKLLHFLNAAEVLLELSDLELELDNFLLREQIEGAVSLHLLQLVQTSDTGTHGLEVGQHAAQPSLIYKIHTAALSLGLNSVLCLLLGADEQDGAALCCDLKYCLVSFVHFAYRLLQVDDVDTVSLGEDIRSHFRVPSSGLMSEMNTCFK